MKLLLAFVRLLRREERISNLEGSMAAPVTISSSPDALRESRSETAGGPTANVSIRSSWNMLREQKVCAFGSPTEAGDAARGVVREYRDVLKKLADH
jgi:hypothetical protein